MIVQPRTLDCAPLTPTVGAHLSDAHLRRIEPLQRTLLSPLDHSSIDHWRGEVNRALRTAFDSDAAMFQLDLDGVALQYSEEFHPAHVEEYVQEQMPTFARNQRLYQRAARLGAGNRSILWADDLEWLYGSEYFNELILPMYAFDPLWAAAAMEGGRYPAMIHTYHDRRQSGQFFGAADVALMRLVQPALKAAVRTLGRTAAHRTSLTAVLDARRDAALVYDFDGRLLHQTPSVATLSRTRLSEKAITTAARRMARSLAAGKAADALRPGSVDLALTTRTGSFQLSAVLLGEGMFTLRPAVLVTVTPHAAPLPDRATLRERHGLTPRQSEVAVLLAGRKTNPEIATELCISEHTARSHTEAVMGKLGVHDRREVAAALRVGQGEARKERD
jgi:DNA-binding CsgD family transcriptional regulator